jgi:hypothetical protein
VGGPDAALLKTITIMFKVASVRAAAESATRYVPTHRQVHTSIGVDVDEGVRDLLEALWAHGFRTEFSCQGGDAGVAHICFSEVADAVRFAAGPGDLEITAGERRAWVDFPAAQIDMLTRHWSDCRCPTRTSAA